MGEYYGLTETMFFFLYGLSLLFVCKTANGNSFFGTSKEVLRVKRLHVNELCNYIQYQSVAS